MAFYEEETERVEKFARCLRPHRGALALSIISVLLVSGSAAVAPILIARGLDSSIEPRKQGDVLRTYVGRRQIRPYARTVEVRVHIVRPVTRNGRDAIRINGYVGCDRL